MKRLRTALIGCGKVGGIHAEALSHSVLSELVGVCDRDVSRAQQFAAKYGGAPFSDVAALLGDAESRSAFRRSQSAAVL